MSVTDSPLSVDGGTEWNEDAVQGICFARIFLTDEEWDAEPEHEWEITREEAATRVDEEDWSPPDWYQPGD